MVSPNMEFQRPAFDRSARRRLAPPTGRRSETGIRLFSWQAGPVSRPSGLPHPALSGGRQPHAGNYSRTNAAWRTRSESFEQRRREVALGERRDNDDNVLANKFGASAEVDASGGRRSRGNADRDAFKPRHQPCRVKRGLIAD